MFGVAHQGSGRARVSGIRPDAISAQRTRQWPKFGKLTIARSASRKQLRQHRPRRPHRLQRLGEDGVVEGAVRIFGEVAVGVALKRGQPLDEAGGHVVRPDLQAPALHGLVALKQFQQFAGAAAHVEHARAGAHEAQDLAEVLPHGRVRGAHSPSRSAPAPRKPAITPSSTGSSSRKASWPLSLSISTKLTRAPAAFSARVTLRLSAVG